MSGKSGTHSTLPRPFFKKGECQTDVDDTIKTYEKYREKSKANQRS